MERDYGREIDDLREQMENLQNKVFSQLDELRAMVMELLPNKPITEKLKRVHVMHGMHPDSRLSEQMEDLCYKTEEKGSLKSSRSSMPITSLLISAMML